MSPDWVELVNRLDTFSKAARAMSESSFDLVNAVSALIPTQSKDLKHLNAQDLINIGEINSILDTTHMWLWQTDDQNKFTYLSPQFSRVTKLSEEIFVGKTIEDLVASGTSIPLEAKRLRGMLLGKRSYHDDIHRISVNKDGRQETLFFNGSGWPTFDEGGGFKGYVGLGRDVTDKRQFLAGERRAMEHIADAMNVLKISVLTLDQAHKISFFNKRWRELHRGMSERFLRTGVDYSEYLSQAIDLHMFPEAEGRKSEYMEWRIGMNENPPGRPIKVLRQDEVVLSISIDQFSDGMTAIISTPIKVSGRGGTVNNDEMIAFVPRDNGANSK